MPGEAANVSCRCSEVKSLKPVAEYKCSLELSGTQSSQRKKNISQLIAKRLPVTSVFQKNNWIAKTWMPALVTITAQRCAAAWSCNVQELTVHNRTSTGWASPPDLMFLKCFTQQAPAGFSEKSVTSRRDLDHSRPPQLQRCKRIRIESLIDHFRHPLSVYGFACAG